VEEVIGGRVGFPVLKRGGDETVSAGLLAVVVLACTSCGNMRTYERRVVTEWISSHPQKKASACAGARALR
jgi:hypothetical protein